MMNCVEFCGADGAPCGVRGRLFTLLFCCLKNRFARALFSLRRRLTLGLISPSSNSPTWGLTVGGCIFFLLLFGFLLPRTFFWAPLSWEAWASPLTLSLLRLARWLLPALWTSVSKGKLRPSGSPHLLTCASDGPISLAGNGTPKEYCLVARGIPLEHAKRVRAEGCTRPRMPLLVPVKRRHSAPVRSGTSQNYPTRQENSGGLRDHTPVVRTVARMGRCSE
mmetsp:Transcript_13106/g.47822  ORF Transcript_13106/g.47822 Transcript_13106/m.47822 type:complete len:222 (+) Transcript_13106:1757-2422(+)